MSSPLDPCRCGHPRETHEHFRPGSDCGECGRSVCPRFRSVEESSRTGRWAARLASVVRGGQRG